MSMLNPPSLYETDILLWVEDTVTKLRARDFEHLDWENLIEEVEAWGISQRKGLLSCLMRLLEHLRKRLYVPSESDCKGWERTIRLPEPWPYAKDVAARLTVKFWQ
ncbi:DUF29 domain-containing protein [Trichothermofontia sichuanensis B231]|uniref:DUF29 domain-containing protein n=1 Tax=Trichothermofontia sichuanensis TaxID=3045816 RepID=UPI0022480E9D|nr:DUF29 domain-containing protein [Trichothermofontia sichuanensis]UZQ56163.1 DUF29 domain-containing protein [Trichothermofontia sichuanensis B231]